MQIREHSVLGEKLHQIALKTVEEGDAVADVSLYFVTANNKFLRPI